MTSMFYSLCSTRLSFSSGGKLTELSWKALSGDIFLTFQLDPRARLFEVQEEPCETGWRAASGLGLTTTGLDHSSVNFLEEESGL